MDKENANFANLEKDHLDPAPIDEIDWNVTPTQVVPLTEVAEFSENDPEENPGIELEQLRASVTDQTRPFNDEILHSDAHNSYPSRHRVGLYVIVLLLVTAAAAFALVRKMNQLRQATLMARSSDAPTAAGEQVINQAPVDVPAVVIPEQQSEHSPAVVNDEPQNDLPDPRSLPVTEQQRVQLEPESTAPHNLTGEWKVVNTVETTRYRSFDNLEIGFRLVINQTGKEFTAKGEKISENGRLLPPGDRTPIQMNGVIEGDKVRATFIEQGAVRKTSGRFVWRIQRSGAGLRGTFASSAARSHGTSAATKEL